MCELCRAGTPVNHVGDVAVSKSLPPEVERAIREFAGDVSSVVDDVQDTLISALEAGDFDPSSTSSVRSAVRSSFGEFTTDFETAFVDGTESGAKAGRAVAGRRSQLDITFDRVPDRTLRELEDWSFEAANDVVDRMGDDVIAYVRGAQEEGLDIDELSSQLNDELFDGRLKDYESERIARTETISSSNAGTHSAYEDATDVVGERWLTNVDGNQRDIHEEADGQVVAVGGRFVVGGEELRYPGDPRASAENRINCRCDILPVFESDLSDSQLSTLAAGEPITASSPVW